MTWRWPWTSEKRESQPFTDAIVQAIVSQSAGSTPGDPGAIAALETAAGLYALAFASAKVEAVGPVARAVTPAFLALVVRDLIRRGESVHLIEVDRGGAMLRPVGSWDVRGGHREAEWFYRLDLFGPSGNVTRFVPSAAALHFRYAVDPARPWLGLGPLQWARSTGTLAANLEIRLGEGAGASVGAFVPIPADGGGDDEPDTDPLAGLKSDIKAAKGRNLLIETTSAGWGSGRQSAPMSDWTPRRFGADPPDALERLRSESGMAVLTACGVPVSLATDADGTSQRESWRRFVLSSCAGVAALVTAELTAKLGTPVHIGFEGLWAHDLVGRAQSFLKLTAGGMAVTDAIAQAGLLMEDRDG